MEVMMVKKEECALRMMFEGCYLSDWDDSIRRR